jgi:S1-C subfamily serine protease
MPRKRWIGLGALGLVAAIAAGTFALTRSDKEPEPDIGVTVQAAVERALKKQADDERKRPPVASAVYQAIAPSMVIIQAEKPSASAEPTDEEGGGLGSGVIIDDQARILTAYHVIEDAQQIRVIFADGTEARAEVETAEPDNDIAVLVPERGPEVIVPAVLGGGVQIGDDVYAVGHPFGLVGSLSAGVVSGLERTIPVADRELTGLIQFDAAANPGNSGGPLLNRAGQVVGVVTALANPANQAAFAGIAFAVPIETAGGAAGGPPR